MSKLMVALFLSLSNSAQGDIRFSPSNVNFGMVQLRSSGYQSVSLYNFGNETVNVYMSNSCFSDFYVSNSCYGRLDPGFSCSLSIRFSPQRQGSQSCQINASDDRQGWTTLSIYGTGYEPRR